MKRGKPRRGKRRQERLGEKLRTIRLALNLSQGQMVQRLKLEEEIDRTDISSYERGRREPSLYIILLYADVAGVCTDLLINDKFELPKRLPSKPSHKP